MEASGQSLDLPDPGEHIPYNTFPPEEREELIGRRFVDVVEVEYEGPGGVRGRVMVPKASYTPAEVDRLIQAELLKHMGVQALGPVPHPENLSAEAGGVS